MSQAAPASISGKKLTVIVLGSMIVVGGLLAYTLQVYSRIDVARERAAVAWRDVASRLDIRYRANERAVAQGVDDRSIPMEYGEKFQLALDRFRTTAIPTTQQSAAQEIERLLASAPPSLPVAVPAGEELSHSIELLNQERMAIQKLLSSPGGRVLDIFLELSQPAPFTITVPAS